MANLYNVIIDSPQCDPYYKLLMGGGRTQAIMVAIVKTKVMVTKKQEGVQESFGRGLYSRYKHFGQGLRSRCGGACVLGVTCKTV